jgi:hypothetical protein
MKVKPWRDRYHVHPAADLFPMMTDAELDELGEDIKKNGLTSPIMLWTDNRAWADSHAAGSDDKDTESPAYLLDGRNRLEACQLKRIDFDSVPCPTLHGRRVQQSSALISCSADMATSWEWQTEVDPVAYIMSANLNRRHLTGAQKRSLIAQLLKLAPQRSDRQVAKDVGASDKTVAAERRELESGAEIPHQDQRVGSDGVTQPAKKGSRKPAAKAILKDLWLVAGTS